MKCPHCQYPMTEGKMDEHQSNWSCNRNCGLSPIVITTDGEVTDIRADKWRNISGQMWVSGKEPAQWQRPDGWLLVANKETA